MYTAKASLILVAVIASVAVAQAAGGIKGQRQTEESQQRIQGLKRPQAYLPPPPPPAPQASRLAPAQATKGPGKVAPVFTAARVQPALAVQQQEQEPEQQQQQTQESETDPAGAAQDPASAIIAPAAAAAASEEEANPRPEPYAFNYAFEAGDSATSGSSTREEQQDASGKVTGFYTLKGEDGRDRRVDYIADASGFRATISTNELGTAPKDSADVDWNAQSPTDAQLRAAESATQAARQRALLNPQLSASTNQGKLSSPRQNQQRGDQYATAASSKGQQQVVAPIAQLQEPFEQIRQTELKARKSRHAPFYLYTV